jgi:hypothetical protein
MQRGLVSYVFRPYPAEEVFAIAVFALCDFIAEMVAVSASKCTHSLDPANNARTMHARDGCVAWKDP